MLQQLEMRQRFRRIERDIQQAASACEANTKLPQDLKECVKQWKQHTKTTKDILASENERNIRICIDDLEEIGERAELALRDAIGVDAQIKNAVANAHRELADLKKQLH